MPRPIVRNSKQSALSVSWYSTIDRGNATWLIVPTGAGFVIVSTYLDPRRPQADATELRMIYGGTIHSRFIKGKSYSERYCVTLARRFAAEVSGKEAA
jgi:hypothetical protein